MQAWTDIHLTVEGEPRKCTGYFHQEEDRGYSCFLIDFKGVQSQSENATEGDIEVLNFQSAVRNLTEAAQLAVDTYEELGQPIKWLSKECESDYSKHWNELVRMCKDE